MQSGEHVLLRKVTKTLHSWKSTSGKALLVTGARQIGKSYAIRDFGQSNYKVYIELNLLLDKEALHALANATSAADFINRIALLSPTALVEHETLVFIDEIQEYPEIVTIMKALAEDGRYDFVFSGSMLGTQFKGISSFPVGYVEQVTMRPMDFEEFCWAIGIDQSFLDQIRSSLRNREPVEKHLHDIMMKNYRAYIIAGGMPEVVQEYVDSNYSLAKTRHLQTQLVAQYAQDISRYADKRALEIRAIFDQIPLQLEDDGTHRFKFSSLRENARAASLNHDFLWLVNAGVGLQVLQATEARSPLKRTEQSSRFKLYESDTGMLVSRYPQSAARSVYLDMKDANLGGIYENVVAQELAALGIDLWYYQSDVGEVDFLMEGEHGRVIPIEVKSGRKVRSHAALDHLLDIDDYKIREALVLSRNNLSQEGRITYVPLYMSFCLDELADSYDSDFSFAPALP